MRLSRPHYLVFEPRESPEWALQRLLSGQPDADVTQWVALAPHLGQERYIEAGDLAVFGALASTHAEDRDTLAERFGRARISRLVDQGLLIGDHDAHADLRRRDARLRDEGWWGPAALAQVFGRWEGVDVAATEREEGRRNAQALIDAGGVPPPEALSLGAVESRLGLPTPRRSNFDELLDARLTCRNFDPAAQLDAGSLATVLHRVFAARGSQVLAPGATMLKKSSPSGGGLHPVEAFVLAQRVEGLAPGLYHYHCLAHALEPLATLSAEAAATAAHDLVAGQPWFANAPALVLMAARYPRSYWKYRNHAKAWKVVQLDAGHLSQTLYLSATEQGLGAFVTAAINDACAERLFALDGLDIAPVAVCGFGERAAQVAVRELDPLGRARR